MADEFEGKIDAEGKFELTRSFWKTLKGTFALPQVSRRLAQAAGKKKVLDWYDIRDYPLDTARNDEFITGFPSRGGDCILVLSITAGASTQIKFDNVNSDSFELANYRKLRHNFSNFYLTNTAQAGSTLKILFGRGDWEVVRHYPEEEIVAINADTVDGLHASASIEPGSLLALGPDGFFPCGAVRCLQNELFANLPAAPVVGDVFISSDTGELYICFVAGAWTNILTPTAGEIAFVPAGDIVATDVQAAIEELDAEKLADVADVINDTHIDWGVGANQVSAADIPIADPGAIIVAVQVEGALQEIMTDLNLVEVDLNGFPDELKNLIAHEIQQLETLGAVTTISAAQWAWLGGFDPICLVRAWLNGDQVNLVNNTWTKVLLNNESFDVGSDFNLANSRFVAPITGYYQVNAVALFKNAVTDSRYIVAIYVNGAAYTITNVNSSYITAYISGAVSDIIYITAGQFIELYVRSNSGDNTVDIGGANPTDTFISIHFLGE